MRNIFLYAGIVVLIVGALITAGLVDYQEKTELLKLGDTEISVTEKKTPDRRLGYALMALGVVGIGVGVFARGRR